MKNIKTMGDKYWDHPWTIVKWCTHTTEGCDNCWSARMSQLLPNSGEYMDAGKFKGEIQIARHMMKKPLKIKGPAKLSIWNDLFHDNVCPGVIKDTLDIVEKRPDITFISLTKRAQNIYEKIYGWGVLQKKEPLPENFWPGVTIELPKYEHRFDHLIRVPAAVYVLSIEPLLGPVSLKTLFSRWAFTRGAVKGWSALFKCRVCGRVSPPDKSWGDCPSGQCFAIWQKVLKKIWVILGGESSKDKGRPMHPDWVWNIYRECLAVGASFYFKQWGGYIPTWPYVRPGDILLRRDGIISGEVVEVDGRVSNIKDISNGRYNEYGYRHKDGLHKNIKVERSHPEEDGEIFMRRISKKRAGRIFKSRTYNNIPEKSRKVYFLTGGLHEY